jgi:hypothetical protein
MPQWTDSSQVDVSGPSNRTSAQHSMPADRGSGHAGGDRMTVRWKLGLLRTGTPKRPAQSSASSPRAPSGRPVLPQQCGASARPRFRWLPAAATKPSTGLEVSAGLPGPWQFKQLVRFEPCDSSRAGERPRSEQELA